MAPTSGFTCSGTPTGAQLTYDNQGRLTVWQNAPSNPTSTEAMAYDGEGQRVALKVNGGAPTYYLGSLEEITGATLTKYFTAAWTSDYHPHRDRRNAQLSDERRARQPH